MSSYQPKAMDNRLPRLPLKPCTYTHAHPTHALHTPHRIDKQQAHEDGQGEMARLRKPYFRGMTEAELRQWVEANPGRVNDRDKMGSMPLVTVALDVGKGDALALLVRLLDDKGVDVNATTRIGTTAVKVAASLDILIALLDRGADPIQPNRDGELPLMFQAARGTVDAVARLLQDPRVRATVNVQDVNGNTALHHACISFPAKKAASKVHLLLQTNANPTITNRKGRLPLDLARYNHYNHHALIALLEQYPAAQKDAQKASLLVKARRLAVAAPSGNTVAPSWLQGRVARGQLLPRVLLRRVVLTPVAGGPDEEEEGEEDRKLHSFYAFLLGVGGPRGKGMPKGVFQEVMDLLQPSWDPLKRKNGDTGPSAVLQG